MMMNEEEDWIELCLVLIIPYMSKLFLYKNIFGVCTFLYGVLVGGYYFVAALYQATDVVGIENPQ